ncbi:MAG TPA: LLM class F420-dependent oxidoreductase [Actinomycetota bacterium]|nr:LLM class F420-dependent oxidoreductase [Actinomycetota bacterium]
MEIGLQIPSFTWGPDDQIGPTLGRIGLTADESGFHSIWVMDHFFQIPGVGDHRQPMLEAYTALGFLAAQTERCGLGTLVTGVTYRYPGILAKTVTTLDVLSGGRAWLGIGAAWNQHEHEGLGVPFPPVKERFEQLEDALRIALQMWSEDDGPFDGKRFHLTETVNQPQPVQRPRPKILIGGSGEQVTLKLVARYADACNLFGDATTVRHKLGVLREHCEREGRDYEEIWKTAYYRLDPGREGVRVPQMIDELGALAEAGAQGVIGGCRGVQYLEPIEILGREVIPKVASL